ncbi:MAG: dynamin family protein [Candidatus Cloacimonetes bacterium]|nr:dynamin family protein [Candidatus Cloacimonadota bacterium]
MINQELPQKIASLYSELEAASIKFDQMQKECRDNSKAFNEQFTNTFNENRLLRIAIIGQVKAGKSSFLNTFLFDGEEVLPKAATPKTANLTIIRHSEDCRVEIEFYSQSDWERMQNSADEYLQLKNKYDAWLAEANKQGKPIPVNPNSENYASSKAAFEMVDAARKNNLDISSIIASKRKTIAFDDLSRMRSQLDEFVGESGKLTPISKAVYLYVNDPRLSDLEIVDTPGLNDPVPARTEKTREILKTTDVAFFLSQTGGAFFDANDVNLLVSQLPSDGINNFVLIGSKYDSALQNYLDSTSLMEVEADIHRRNNAHAEKTLTNHLVNNEFISSEIKDKLLACLPPIYISAQMHNFTIKSEVNWDNSERNTYQRLLKLSEKWQDFCLDQDTLIRMGNIATVTNKYHQVKSEKNEILLQKIRALTPSAAQKLQELIKKIKEKSAESIAILQHQGVAELVKQENQLTLQIDGVKAGVSEVIGDLISSCAKNSIDTKARIREETTGLSQVLEKTGTKQEWVTRTVARTKGWWIFKRTVYEDASYEKTVTFRYATVNNALDNLRKGSALACNEIETLFNELIEPKKLRLDLLNVIRESFDAEDDSFNPNFFKQVIQEAMDQISFPSIRIDPSTYIEEMANQFPKPQQTDTGVDKLNIALGNAMNLLGLNIIDTLDREVASFREKLQEIRKNLGKMLINRALEDINKLKQAMQNKETEIEEYSSCVKACEELSVKVKRELV